MKEGATMGEIAAVVGAAVAVTGLIGTILYQAAIKPLTSAIEELRELIAEMKRDLRNNEEKRQVMDLRLAKLESSTASAHHRIDTLETQVRR